MTHNGRVHLSLIHIYFIANLANLSAALKQTFNFFWVGFYLVKGDELVLGPFQGPIAVSYTHLFGLYGIFLAFLLFHHIPRAQRKALLISILLFVGYNLVYGMKDVYKRQPLV